VRRHHRRWTVTVLAIATVVMSGCGGTDAPPLGGPEPGDDGSADDGGVATAGDSDPPASALDATVRCGSGTYDPATLGDAPSVSSLPEGPAGAVDDVGDAAFDPAADWRVLLVTEDRAELLRELDEPSDLGEGDVRTHELRVVERITGATNVADGTWLLTESGPCTPRVELVGLGLADLTLAATPSPETRTVELLVHERECASGQTAEGRVELAGLEETAEEVRLLIGVRRLDGAQTCPSNPPTPFTVELSEPLGERAVVDASLVPPRPLTVGDTAAAG
jgi:hypothetical protein